MEWMLDQTGRLMLDGKNKDYKPTEEDVQEFQLKLKELLEQKGM